MHFAAQLPGPGAYAIDDARAAPSGGRFNLAKSKSELEWAEHRARQLPGPGEYDARDHAVRRSPHTGKFSFVYRPTDPAHQHLAKGIPQRRALAKPALVMPVVPAIEKGKKNT